MRLHSPVYELAIAALMLVLVAASAPMGHAQSTTRSERHWISLGPKLSSAAAGATVTYSVSVGTSSDYFPGEVSVTIPSGVTVIGQPVCSSGCWQPSVLQSSTGSQIQTTVTVRSGESASFSFPVQVDPTTAVGTTFQLTAYLLGGVNTAGSSETAFATLQVMGSSVPPTSSRPNQPLEDEPPISIEPDTLSVSPGEKARFRVKLAGDGSMGTFLLTVTLPKGIQYTEAPACFSLLPGQCLDADFETRTNEASDGSTVVQLRGSNIVPTRFTLQFTVEIADTTTSDDLTVDATVESVRRWGPEPIGEASIAVMVNRN